MKKRILFVETNPLLLQVYAAMLNDERAIWEVATASDAREALNLMENGPFDVVVSDMRLNGTSGIELITQIQDKYPKCSRIVLAGYSDQEEFARSLDATHQFLAKPFDVKALKGTLARIGGLDVFLKEEKLRALASRMKALPSFPSLYVEIMKELNSPEPSIENIAGVMTLDPSMTAKMLQVVNSAVFGLARQISSPFEAVQYLGMGMVRSLALSAHVFARFEHTDLKGLPVRDLWEHSMRSALAARTIMRCENADAADADAAYTAAMLHDVGKLMLADNLPREYQQALSLAVEKKIPVHEAELAVFGATHAGAAAYLLGLWGLPAPIVEAVAFHHTPGHSSARGFSPLAAVHAADVLEHELSKTKSPIREAEMDLVFLASIGKKDRIEVWRKEAAQPAGE